MTNTQPLNSNFHLGQLVYLDPSPFDEDNLKDLNELTKNNINTFYQQIFTFYKSQAESEVPYSLDLPAGDIALPRYQPLPKEKGLTKWEKFRKEKGIAPRKKRSRMVFDEITDDWVPRWGKGSIKKIEDQHNWLLEEKEGDIPIEKMDLFTQEKLNKSMKVEK